MTGLTPSLIATVGFVVSAYCPGSPIARKESQRIERTAWCAVSGLGRVGTN